MSTETPAPPLTAAQRRVLEHVDNPFTTSPEQAAAVKHDSDFFLSACPGAGKTHTVGLRLAYHAAFHSDISVAAVSHTNTAIDAIHAAARELTALPEHYWVGTLHAFLLRYVVYPFGHLYMGCTAVPQVAGDERDWPDDIPDVSAHDDYRGCRVKAWKFDVHLGSRLTYQRPGDWPQPLTEDVIVGGLTEWPEARSAPTGSADSSRSRTCSGWPTGSFSSTHSSRRRSPPASMSSSSMRFRTQASCSSSASSSCARRRRTPGSSSSATSARPSTSGRGRRRRGCASSQPTSSSKSCR